MIEDNWDLIQGVAAHEIEVLNYSNQVNVIEALVHLYMHHYVGEGGGCTVSPDEYVLREFHRTATLFLLNRPGFFREEEVVVRKGDGTVVHQPPNKDDMGAHLERFLADMKERWSQLSAQELGAYALWMVNWVHPFKNGNGRTARAFCYACISLKFGFVLPGKSTLIDLIMQQRDEYQNALKAADTAYENHGQPDLGPMVEFVDRLLAEQLTSIG